MASSCGTSDRVNDAFLSYARSDNPGFRQALASGLSRRGLRIWFDRESLPSRGTTFDQEIRRAIESSARLLLIVAPGALASEYVAQEWGYADDLGVPVVPVLQQGDFRQLPQRLQSYHAVDARAPITTEAAIAEIARLLSEPVTPLGLLLGVPPPVLQELVRPDLLEHLSSVLTPDRQRPEESGRAPRAAALYGTSGIGKSTVAAAFVRSTRTRRTFPDGIAWLPCGPSFEQLAGARNLLARLAPGARLPSRTDEVPSALAEGLGEREIFLVLDDVRNPEAVAPFVGALGPGGRVLLTILDQAVATALGAIDVAVEQLDDASSRRLLAGWASGTLPPEAEPVLTATDGFPFALAIVGAMVRNRVPWALVAEAFEARRLDLVRARFPGYPHPNLLRALAVSYDALAAEDAQSATCFLELAAFRPGASLPASAMVRLWSRPGRLEPLDAALVLPVLERRLLVLRRPAPDGDRYVLHGLHEDFVRLECPNPAELEAALVASYRREKRAASWSTLPDDGYIHDHLVFHLASLGERAELVSTVDAEWVRGHQLRHGDFGQALDDVQAALAAAVAPPFDLPAVVRLSMLTGQVTATLRDAPSTLIGAMAAIGDTDQALHWAADKSDPEQRFEALVAASEALVRRGDVALARRAIRTAAATISMIGRAVETGTFAGLTAMNAVHAVVDFPWPDQWEGTTAELVAEARIPVDAVVRLAPLAARVGVVAEVAQVSHPFWELYGHLIPLVAAEQLADRGDHDAAAALLDSTSEYVGEDDDDDRVHADQYRRAVAAAALGRFDAARASVETSQRAYRGVGYRGLARHLAAAGRAEEAVELLALIDDEKVADRAAEDVIGATIDRAEPDGCRRVAQYALERGWAVATAWLLAAGGDPPAFGLEMLDRSPRDDLSLGLGVRLGSILHDRRRAEDARDVARRLVPIAERLLGAQWFAPETIGAEPELASLARGLLSLLARAGERLPDAVTALALVAEMNLGGVAEFKLLLIIDLAFANRFEEARTLAATSTSQHGRALGLATALSAASAQAPAEECRRAASDLAEALDGIEPGPMLSPALGAAMRKLTAGELRDAAERLVEPLIPRPSLWSAIGVWAQDRASAGRRGDVRRLVRRLLMERPLRAPDAGARALLLCALAARRPGAGVELKEVTALLANVRTAAAALDIVFEVVDIHARCCGLAAAGSFASSVAEGKAASLVEEFLKQGSVRWEGELQEGMLEAAAAVRAVASASMALSTIRDGSGGEAEVWLARAEALLAYIGDRARRTGAASAAAKYVGAARVALGHAAGVEDARSLLAIAWLLRESGFTTAAVRHARGALGKVSDPIQGLSRLGPTNLVTAAEFERGHAVSAAVSAILGVILAMAAASRGDILGAKGAIGAAVEHTHSPGWLSLTLGEQAEVHASLAIGLKWAGETDAARERLQKTTEAAFTLARRGETGSLGRPCQALLELLPPEQASPIWSEWLISAAGMGANEAAQLIACYVRWLPDADLASMVVGAKNGGPAWL